MTKMQKETSKNKIIQEKKRKGVSESVIHSGMSSSKEEAGRCRSQLTPSGREVLSNLQEVFVSFHTGDPGRHEPHSDAEPLQQKNKAEPTRGRASGKWAPSQRRHEERE